jgi:UDP-glucose 4-epimerase
LRRPFIAADREVLTIDEMIAAMRDGLGRRPNVFAVSPALLRLLFRSIGHDNIYRRMSGSLVADPSALIGLGWAPPLNTADGLCRLMRAGKQAVPRFSDDKD